MWRAAKATYPRASERIMRELRGVNEEAFKYIMQIPPIFRSKSIFKSGPKCDSLLNNMSEAFKYVVVDAREKPIVMLEDIRIYIMEMWESNRFKIPNYEGSILPRIMKRLEREAEYTSKWIARYNSFGSNICKVKIITLNLYLVLLFFRIADEHV